MGRRRVIPKYGVCPVLAIVVVYRHHRARRGRWARSARESIVSWEMVTVAVQRGPGLAARQLLLADGEVMVLARIMLPVSGLCTVTV